MTIVINPANLTPDDSKKLFAFFEAQSQLSVRFWYAGKSYTFPDQTEFALAHNVVQRKRKEGNTGVRYEFISDNILGSGQYGIVYEIAGTLAIDSESIRYKQAGYNNKSRVVKIQVHDTKYPEQKVMTEYAFANLASHLRVKEPVFENSHSYLVMRKMKGELLEKIIAEDLSGAKKLSFQQRLGLSIALLNALKEQVTDKGIIHRDIKDSNILVDLTDPITVNIFDYAFSVAKNNPDGRFPGSPIYASPELFDGNPQTPASDVFSMARVLELLWHIDVNEFNPFLSSSCSLQKSGENARNIRLSTLFMDLPEVSTQNRSTIKTTLQGMLRRDYLRRLSVEQAISRFERIMQQESAYLAHILPPSAAALNRAPSQSKTSIVDDVVEASKKRIELIMQQIGLLQDMVTELWEQEETPAADSLLKLASLLEEKMKFLMSDDSHQYCLHLAPMSESCRALLTSRVTKNVMFFKQTKTLSLVEKVGNTLKELEEDGERLFLSLT